MKLLYFMVLLIFGDGADLSCNVATNQANWTKMNVFYNSTGGDILIAESTSAPLCKWGTDQCYADCTSVNLSINITDLNNMTSEENIIPITNERKMLVFKLSGQEATCTVTKCVRASISTLLFKSFNSNDLKDLKRSTNIKSMCTNLITSDKTIKNLYIRVEKMYIDALISIPFNEATKNYNFEVFNMLVVQTDMVNTTDLGLVQISAPKVPGDDLPLDVFIPTKPFLDVSKKLDKVAIVTYPSAQLFISDTKTVLMSKVIRVETVGQELKDFTTRLVINFVVRGSDIISENHTLSCRFYNMDAIPEQEWDDMGSFTNLDNFNSTNTVNCSYNHMTPFAVLLVDMTQIDPVQWKILSYISYTGCSLSAFFTAVTIFLYTFMKRSNRDNSMSIHVSLSAAVFLLNTSFLFIEWGATWSQESLCVLIAVIIQYSLLSCFSWMAIEAVHLYLLLIKVFNTYIKHYMMKLSLFGWGVPAVLVGGSLCVFGSNRFYGTVPITTSNANEKTQFCWITDARFLYGVNITYFSITFLFNTSILLVVTLQIFKLRHFNVRGSKLPTCKDFCTVLGLTLLLGMTWGLAFFTSGYTNYPILYLFCICNSLQGLFLFLWFYGTMQKNRRLMTQSSSVSQLTITTVNNSESNFIH